MGGDTGNEQDQGESNVNRVPSMYVNHGGGPMPLFAPERQGHGGQMLTDFLKSIQKYVATGEEKQQPKAILVVSAHFQTKNQVRVSSGENPSLLFDYYGFPRKTYDYKYPVKGDPALAQKVKDLIQAIKVDCVMDPDAQLDHGVFVPLMLAYPEANIPVVSLSLDASLSPELHYKIGQALRPLRDPENRVLILGSGLSFHNLREISMNAKPGDTLKGEAFNEDMTKACLEDDPERRKQSLVRWEQFRGARIAHPTEEHFIPLLVAAGAAGVDKGSIAHTGPFAGTRISSIMFGGSSNI